MEIVNEKETDYGNGLRPMCGESRDMGIALWVVQALLAVAFLVSGATKLSRPKEKLRENMAWVEDFSQGAVRIIGILEVLGAIGIVLPALTGIVPWLTPLAAVGLVLTMGGAALTHLRRAEYGPVAVTAILLILAAFVAYGRFFVLLA
jgi:uncharacterized membrane protein YphA (DoxX/SURF4 family)